MIKKLSILAVGLAVGLSPAFATTVSLSIQETGTVGSLTASSSTGFVSIANAGYGDFQINDVSGTGSPVFNTPNLNLQTLNVSSLTLAASKTLTIELTETGLTGIPNPALYFNAFSGILNGVSSEKLTTYTDPSNTAFGTTDQVATATFTTKGGNSFNVSASAPTGHPFSETEIIVATFGPTSGKADSLDSSIFMGTAIPEPASLALIGVGLLGLAVARKRRASK